MQSLEQVFKVKDRKAELQAQKEADRLAKQKAAQKMARQAAVFERQQQQEAPRLKQQEADRKERLAQQKAEQKAAKQAKRQHQSELESLQQQAKSQQQCDDSSQRANHLTHQPDSNSLFHLEEGGEECAQEEEQDQWALDQQAVERMCQLDMERWRQREADRRAEQLRMQHLKQTRDSGFVTSQLAKAKTFTRLHAQAALMLLRKTMLHTFWHGYLSAAADPSTREILAHSALKVLISISPQNPACNRIQADCPD